MSAVRFDGWMLWGKRIAGLCGLAVLCLTQLGNTCGAGLDAETPDACLFDTDCFDDEACVNGECRVTCTADSQCAPSEVCGVVATGGGTVQACVMDVPNGGTNNAGECVSDAECQETNERALCGVDGFCFVPQTVSALLLEDATPAAALEAPEDPAAGADIAAVYLVDKDNVPVAFADTLVARGPSGERIVSHLMGERPMLNAEETCVEGDFESATTSLGGEGGYMLVSFRDANGQPVNTPPEDWRVMVIEWADNCDMEIVEPAERATARGCVAPTYDAIDLETSCEVDFGQPFSGKAVLDPV